MEASVVKNKQDFNNFVSSQHFSQFLQSYDWAEFQEKSGNRVLPLAVFDDNGKITASALLIKRKVPFFDKNYWYCPRGPIIKNDIPYGECYSILLQYISRIAGKEKIIFTRWEPAVSPPDKGYKTIKTIDIQPSRTIMLDLSFFKEELLKNMHQKTRYNTRLASKKGVEVREAEEKEFDEFWDLMEITAKRDNFRLHGRQHYKKMLWAAPHIFRLFLAKYEDKTIAGNIVSFFGDTVTYVHGASDHEYRKFMAPYALQWEVISLAKEQGFRYYDLYGVDDNKWPGVTRFKRGFGGEEIQYPGTYDVVFDKKRYWVYKIARSVRRRI